MTAAPAGRRPRRHGIRARIAIACAGLFLLLGGVLVGATYALVARTSPQASTRQGPALPPALRSLWIQCAMVQRTRGFGVLAGPGPGTSPPPRVRRQLSGLSAAERAGLITLSPALRRELSALSPANRGALPAALRAELRLVPTAVLSGLPSAPQAWLNSRSAAELGALQPAVAAELDTLPPAVRRVTSSLPPAFVRSCQQVRGGFHGGTGAQRQWDRREFLLYSLTGLGLATVLAGGLGWAISGRVLRPLRAITEAARTASQENLDQPLALAGPPDELKELADTFDAMLARLDAGFASQRRFVANASHELRTPLTELRALADVTLARGDGSARAVAPALAGVRAAVDRAEELIEALLTLARSDAGLSQAELVDLPTAVEDAIDLAASAAAARRITVRAELQPATVTGDRVLIERLASNLIDNAVRHNQPGGWVRASVRPDAGFAELVVANGGEPIPAGEVAGLFEPFRRLGGRTGTRTGTGLGLSIVASVAGARGGRATARARPGGGLEVRVRLPAAPRDDGGGGRAARRVAPVPYVDSATVPPRSQKPKS